MNIRILYKIPFYIFSSIITCFILYISLSFILSTIPHQKHSSNEEKTIDIYVISNGVHLDIITPYKNSIYNWQDFYDFPKNIKASDTYKYIAFGYGDRKFYTETPNWSDLTFSTAFNAIILPSETAMHVTIYKKVPQYVKKCINVKISHSGYKQLIEFIHAGFQLNNNKPILIPGISYRNNDAFYEGAGKYTMVKTCNEWINRALKKSGLKVCSWSPFGRGIFYQLEKQND